MTDGSKSVFVTIEPSAC